jgi:tetratricopeptide (TPR) repeat protein
MLVHDDALASVRRDTGRCGLAYGTVVGGSGLFMRFSTSRLMAYRRLWLAVLVAGVTFAVFYPVLGHELLYWDDLISIVKNPELNPPTPHSLWEFWRHPIEGYFRSYVPLTYSIWWVVAHFARVPASNGEGFEFVPAAFHALNVGFHTLAALLAFLVLRRLSRADWAAAAGALLFALHPLQVEAVCWAANMYTPLSGMLALAAIYLCMNFLDGRRSEEPAARSRAVLMFAVATWCFVLSLLSKPVLVLLPLMMLAIEMLLNGRRLRDCAALTLWAAIALADVLITCHAHPGIAAFKPSVYLRPLVACDSFNFYLWKLLVPVNLITDYGRSPQWVLKQSWVAWVWVIPVAMLAGAWLLRRRAPWVTCGVLCFALALVPMLGLAPFDYQFYSTVADRYAYFSIFGAALALCFALPRLRALKLPPVVAPAGCCLLLAIMAIASLAQSRYWRDTGALWDRTLAINPGSVAANAQYAWILLKGDDPVQLRRGLNCVLAARENAPNDTNLIYQEGTVLLRLGEPAAAVTAFRELKPLRPEEPAVPYMLARSLSAAGNPRAAAAEFSSLLSQHPGYADAELKLAETLAALPNRPVAIYHTRLYLRDHPDSSEARGLLAALQSNAPQAAIDPR